MVAIKDKINELKTRDAAPGFRLPARPIPRLITAELSPSRSADLA